MSDSDKDHGATDREQLAELRATLALLADRVSQLEGRIPLSEKPVSAPLSDDEPLVELTPIAPKDKFPREHESHLPRKKPRDVDWQKLVRPPESESRQGATPFDLAKLEQLIGGRWLTWLGGLLLILAVAFFVPWAWQNFNTPAWLRISLFHLAGIGIVGLGVWLRSRPELTTAAHGTIGVGLFTLYAAALAMRELYKFGGDYSSHLAFADWCLISLAAVVLAVRFNSPGLVLLGALGGYLTPGISTGRIEPIFFLTYLAFLNVALLASASIRNWTFIKPLVFVATVLMFLVAIASVRNVDTVRWQIELFAALHGLILLTATTLPAVVRKKPAEMLDLRTMAATSMAFMGITWYLFHESPQRQLGLVALGLAALHFLLGRTLATQQVHRESLYRVHLVMAIAFLTLSVPMQLHQQAGIWAVTWGVEALAFTAMGVWFRDRQLVIAGLSIFAVGLMRLFGYDYFLVAELLGRQRELGGLDRRLVLSAVVGTMMLLAGGSFWWVGRQKQPPARKLFETPIAEVLLIAGHLVILCGLIAEWPNATGCMIVIANAPALFLLGFGIDRFEVRYYAAGLLLGGALPWMVALTGENIDATQPWGMRFALLSLWSGTALAVGLLYRHRRLHSPAAVEMSGEHLAGQESMLENTLGALGHFVLLGAFTYELRDYMESSRVASAYGKMVELASYSVLWSVYASFAVIAGIAMKYRCYRLFGLAVLLIVLGKVFFMDMATLKWMPRILALAVLGLLMMGVSLLYQRFTSRMEPDQ